MDSCLDRYLSFEYLVSPCPQQNGGGQTGSLTEARNAVERAAHAIQFLRSNGALDERTNSGLAAVESDLRQASALLDSAHSKSWFA